MSTESYFHTKYMIGKKLGVGAFAQVYTVRQARHGDHGDEAVKIIDQRMKVNDETVDMVDDDVRDAVMCEVDILKRVSLWDPCIKMIDAFVDGPCSYIVMEKCDFTLLRALDLEPELTEVSLADILRQVLASLCCIHAVDVVHRDVKPDNFLMKNGVVKLCDFGMSDVLDKRNPTLSGIFGTAPYMSPEMLNNDPYDTKTDVWSFACMAHVLLLGKFPYQPTSPYSESYY